MDTGKSGSMKKCQMENGHFAETNEEFGISGHGRKIEPIRDPVGTSTATRGDYRSHFGIADRVI